MNDTLIRIVGVVVLVCLQGCGAERNSASSSVKGKSKHEFAEQVKGFNSLITTRGQLTAPSFETWVSREANDGAVDLLFPVPDWEEGESSKMSLLKRNLTTELERVEELKQAIKTAQTPSHENLYKRMLGERERSVADVRRKITEAEGEEKLVKEQQRSEKKKRDAERADLERRYNEYLKTTAVKRIKSSREKIYKITKDPKYATGTEFDVAFFSVSEVQRYFGIPDSVLNADGDEQRWTYRFPSGAVSFTVNVVDGLVTFVGNIDMF